MARAAAAAPLDAYVLHRHDWSESSLIVELLTRERGRVVVVARGAKKPTSNFRPVLLPFQRIVVWLGKPPADDAGELMTLRSAEWGGGVPLLAGAALWRGFYVNELLLKLLARQDPHPRLVDAYVQTLPAIAGRDEAAAEAAEAALRAFELVLLREIGLLPDLRREGSTLAALGDDVAYALTAEGGLVAAGADTGVEGRVWRALADALQHETLEPLRATVALALPALRAQLRGLLHYHLGGAPVRTREVLRELQRLQPTSHR